MSETEKTDQITANVLRALGWNRESGDRWNMRSIGGDWLVIEFSAGAVSLVCHEGLYEFPGVKSVQNMVALMRFAGLPILSADDEQPHRMASAAAIADALSHAAMREHYARALEAVAAAGRVEAEDLRAVVMAQAQALTEASAAQAEAAGEILRLRARIDEAEAMASGAENEKRILSERIAVLESDAERLRQGLQVGENRRRDLSEALREILEKAQYALD